MNIPNISRYRQAEGGFALITNVLLMALIGGLAIGLIMEATTETTTNGNFRGSMQAYYAAKAGLEEGRARIPFYRSSHIALPITVSSVVYIVHDVGVQPTTAGNTYYDSEYAAEFPGITPTVTTVTSIQPSSNPIPYQWVRITLKTELSSKQDVNQDGTLNSSTPLYLSSSGQNLTLTGNPVYKITAFAVAPSGSRSMLQMEGATPPPFGVGAAIGTQDDITMLGNFTVSGVDYCNASANVYGVDSTATINVNGNKGTISGVTGPSPNETGTYQNAPHTYDINTLINSLKPYATAIQQVDASVSYNSSTNSYSGSNVTLGVPPPNPPPAGATGTPAVTYAAGNLSVSSNNSKGGGILIVDGDLSVNGGFYFYGMIIVKGTVSFTGGGSNSTNVYGSIITGSDLTTTDSVGGGVNVQYSSCADGNGFSALPLGVLAFREIPNF